MAKKLNQTKTKRETLEAALAAYVASTNAATYSDAYDAIAAADTHTLADLLMALAGRAEKAERELAAETARNQAAWDRLSATLARRAA